MNVILSNPIVSEFLSRYPEEKHTNCLLGIILFGIYNLNSLSIDFSKILAQVEESHGLKKEPQSSSFLSRVKSSLKDEPGDTPRFTTEPNAEKRSVSFSKLDTKVSKLAQSKGERRRVEHVKTPSIVNPDILNEMSGVENSEVLRIADQFLNGQFVNEYCKLVFKEKAKEEGYKPGNYGESRGLGQVDGENGRMEKERKNRTGGSLTMSGRRNSFSVASVNRSVRGDRSTSYSKFW